MNDGEDFYFIRQLPIDDPVAADNDLPEIISVRFGNYSPRTWELRQTTGGMKHPVGEDLRGPGCITRDVYACCIEVFQRGLGPGYGSQRFMRSRASS